MNFNKSKTLGFLPNLCTPQAVLSLVMVAELLAVLLSLTAVSQLNMEFLATLGKTSLFVQWSVLGSAIILCLLARLPVTSDISTLETLGVVLIVTLTITLTTSLMANAILSYQNLNQINLWDFDSIIRDLLISGLISLVALRYFYVLNKWQISVRADCNAEYTALQSRMRPHFLFNSLNSIAQLTLKDPQRAEEAILDLADIFRTTLSKEEHISLGAEIALTLRYLRMEELRVGKRLQTHLDIDTKALPTRMDIPPLLLQPLVENAVYHGIQPSKDGGVIGISIHDMGDRVDFAVTNPISPTGITSHQKGNHIAQENMKNRLEHAYGDEANLRIQKTNHQYRVSFSIPKE